MTTKEKIYHIKFYIFFKPSKYFISDSISKLYLNSKQNKPPLKQSVILYFPIWPI